MRIPDSSPSLADAAGLLQEPVRVHLQRLSRLLRPHAADLDLKFRSRLRQRRYDAKQLKALSAITPGAAAKFLARGRPPADFFEQVEYSGRRLAKLNLPPAEIVDVLRVYDSVLDPLLDKLLPVPEGNLQWARRQLHLCAVVALNSAFHQVRETEARAFYDLFRAEVEAKSLDELLDQFLQNLTRVSQAQVGRLALLNPDRTSWRARAAAGGDGGGQDGFQPDPLTAGLRRKLARTRYIVKGEPAEELILDRRLRGHYRSYWSIPLLAQKRLAGVIQVGFLTERSWLPRELQLLDAAVEQCLLAAEKARLMEDLAAREEQVRQLSEHMWLVEEEERRRISRELHDDAGQSMLLIRLQLEMLEKSLPPALADIRGKLVETRDVTEKTIIEVRRIIAALSPAVLEQLGLAAALRQLANRFRQAYPCHIRLYISPGINRLGRLRQQIEIVTYRLVQECFNNIAKHSSASTVNIHLRSSDRYLVLGVEDDGVGFEVGAALDKRNSFGLSGMRERVGLLGGQFQIESRPGEGTRISVRLPIRT
ncbi:MAG: GAF domain-containing sensor histidine kinase [Candidatus Solibacter usitatus]|nr:GAF domain-containing sensor histidine kinase [Candidatus Solibacter usitatus]